MPQNSVSLQFGIEVEFLLRPKPVMNGFLKKHGFKHGITTRSNDEKALKTNRGAIQASLLELLQIAGIPAGSDIGDEDKYKKWKVVDEPCLDEISEFWRCEIISRILEPNSNWKDEIERVFEALSNNYDIHLTTGCSMHVHVSPYGTGKYNIDQVKRILKAVVYYDAPMTKIMPADRKANLWAQSNVESISAWRTAYHQVPQNKWAPLFDRFDKHKMIPHLLHDMGGNRYLAWNFFNLTDSCGTVEFRRPPGVNNGAHAMHWVAFALGFLANAIAIQDWSVARRANSYPTSDHLRAAIASGVQILGRDVQDALRSMRDVDIG